MVLYTTAENTPVFSLANVCSVYTGDSLAHAGVYFISPGGISSLGLLHRYRCETF